MENDTESQQCSVPNDSDISGYTEVMKQQEQPSETGDTVKNPEALHYAMKTIFFNQDFLYILPLVFLWVVAGYIPATFMPAFSAKYFAYCSQKELDYETCEYNYPLSARWNAIFGAIGGLVSFLCGAFIGDLSDAIGRKPFLYMNVITSALQFAPMIIWPHMWIKLAFAIPSGLNCSDNSLTPTMCSYIADIIDAKSRITAYAITYSVGALGLIVGTVTAIMVEMYFWTELNFVVITLINIIQIVYVYFFVAESLRPELRKAFGKQKMFNPLEPLFKFRAHPVVTWIAVVQFFASLPETGVLEIAITFILDQMDVNDDSASTMISSLFLISAAFGLLVGNMYILPKLQQLNVSDVNILCIGCALSVIAFVFMSLISWFPYLSFVSLAGMLLTLGMISFPAANGLVTKHLNEHEQGIGFGVIFAVRALTWIVAPLFFALVYEGFEKIKLGYITFLIAAFFGVIELLIVIFPLRKLLIMVEETGKVYSFNDTADDDELDDIINCAEALERMSRRRRSSTAPNNNSFSIALSLERQT